MSQPLFPFRTAVDKPVIIAGPCMAESADLLTAVAETLTQLSAELDFCLVFKSSFDKANRTSGSSARGPGLDKGLQMLGDVKERFSVPVLTDVHESIQVPAAAEVCDVLQIPAFLCRQTDLVAAAIATGRAVNIKKGQFLAPDSVSHVVRKAKSLAEEAGVATNVAVTERGVSFGYQNLIVDMRGFATMARTGAPVIFDITHSTQKPAAGGRSGEISGGLRECAPALARAAAATGYLSGFFLEVHTDPDQALSDAAVQLSISQASSLLRQLIPLWRSTRDLAKIDVHF